ncbi:methyl-accepting chemotaxis protein [Zavarzinia sp. CC-PAN008]|uniref:methyl-accepting chemotaxis protein n=1 Tax=Zavarzinia sp. CC-PAN008 TaxID=3243332 RepID=UPI003F74A2E0
MRTNLPVTQREYEFPQGTILVSKTDPGGRINFVNEAFVTVSGFTEEELMGEPHNIVRHPDMPVEAFGDMWATLRSGKPWVGMVKNRRKNGDHYWVRASATPIVEGGQTVGYMSVRTALSAAKIAEAEAVYKAVREKTARDVAVQQGRIVATDAASQRRRTLSRVQPQVRLFAGGLFGVLLLACLSGALNLGWIPALVLLALGAGVAAYGLRIGADLQAKAQALVGQIWGITQNDYDADIDIESDDDLGDVSRYLRALQTKLRFDVEERRKTEADLKETEENARRTQAQLDADKARQMAEQERRTNRVTELSNAFDQQAATLLQSVEGAASALQATARDLASTAEDTNHRSTIVAGASEETSINVNTVAAATEELSASIEEISRQVNQSNHITGKAVDEVARTGENVRLLAEGARKIGDIVDLINDIASRTNLLALNATIEAARAGEAGKGFAVVASEVKALANMTAKATEDIAQQIAAMQQATDGTVNAIEGVGRTIREINEFSAAIASAVEEQGASTQEIVRNIAQAAAGTQEVSSNISGVNSAAAETGRASSHVLSAADDLSRQAGILRTEVDSFLAAVRAA